MKNEDRQVWLREKGARITFAQELKDLAELPIFKKIIEGMLDKKNQLLRIIDDSQSSREAVDDARNKRMAIQWFFESIVITVKVGERAEEEIRRYEEYEHKKQGGVGNGQKR